MDPSSLVFLVIIGIWAAYLLGHWVRRRDQLATARSIDRFSGAMRLLERRRPVPLSAPLSRPAPRGHVVAPARVSRPEVTVKATRPVTAPPAPAAAVSAPRSAPSAPRSALLPTRRRRPSVARKALGVAFLVLVVAQPVVWLLVPLTGLTWPVGVLTTAAMVADVVLLRLRVRRARAEARQARAAVARQARGARRRQTLEVLLAARAHRGAGHSQRDGAERAAAAAGLDRDAATGQAVSGEQSVSDGTGEPAVPAASVDSAATAGQWAPVPVPPPTYTLKSKAPRTAIARSGADAAAHSADLADLADPAAPAGTDEVDEVDEVVTLVEPPVLEPSATGRGGFDLEEVLERRRASGE